MGWTLEIPHTFQASIRMSTVCLCSSCLSSLQRKYLKWYFLWIDALAADIQKWDRNINHGAVPSHQQTKSQWTQILPKILMSSLNVQLINTGSSMLALSSPTDLVVLCNRRMMSKGAWYVSLWDSSMWPFSVYSILLKWPMLFKPQAYCYYHYYILQMDDKIQVTNLTFETIKKIFKYWQLLSFIIGWKRKHLLYLWESPLNIWDFPEDSVSEYKFTFILL